MALLDRFHHDTSASVRARMTSLLEAALTQDAAGARAALLHQAVDRLVPDEARILVALTGAAGPAALVHVHSLTSTGITGEPLLENASLIGRTAQVTLPELTAHYVGRLLGLGLVEAGPERPELSDDYAMVLADPVVLRTLARARTDHLTPRVLRHSLELSTLGRQLCGHLAA